MKFFPFFLVLVFLLSCAPQPSNPAAVAPSASPTATATPVVPGFRAIVNPYNWDKVVTSTDLNNVFNRLHSPDDLSAYMRETFVWQDDYDTSNFLAPQEVYQSRRAVCSGFARFAREALQVQGYQSTVIAFWGTETAHAVCIFLDETGHYRMTSNQFYSKLNDLGTLFDAACTKAAQLFYGESWKQITVYEEGGAITQQFTNYKAPAPGAIPNTPGKNAFRIRT